MKSPKRIDAFRSVTGVTFQIQVSLTRRQFALLCELDGRRKSFSALWMIGPDARAATDVVAAFSVSAGLVAT